jgi:hypothetical protein
VKNTTNNVTHRVIGIFTGRNKRRPTARRVIEQHGSELIKSIAVCREPVTSAVEKTMNLISLGGLNKAKNDLQHGKLLHLYMHITTDKGTSIINEKNEVIGIEVKSIGSKSDREVKQVPLHASLTVSDFIENNPKYMGDRFPYSANVNNCQNYIDSCLSANHLNDSDLKKFVLQDSEQIFKHMPSYMSRMANKISGLASHIDVLKDGMGRKRKVIKLKSKIGGRKKVVKRKMIGGLLKEGAVRTNAPWKATNIQSANYNQK